MNNQPIEKRVKDFDGQLSVHSIFQTIQGEGPFCGTACVFIRLAGCNLQCPACDTEYTQGRKQMTTLEIVSEVCLKAGLSKLVVITGGEPFRQNITELVNGLIRRGFYIQIETNGSLPPPLRLIFNDKPEQRRGLYMVCSPKTGRIHKEVMAKACALKYVVEHDNIRELDGLPKQALQHTANPFVARPDETFKGLIYVQPMDAHDDAQNKLNNDAAIKSCINFDYILQIQVHKYIGVE